MCGIAGVIGHTTEQEQHQLLQLFEQSLTSRGPDGHGSYIDSEVLLFHRRLSIIGLETGAQPLKGKSSNSNDDDLILIANGEIYNYIELKKDLPALRTESDCEVILPLYQKYGLEFISLLRGMYAFALYDQSNNRVILSRDTYGIKPLYYANDDQGRIIFASTMKEIVDSGLVACDIDTKESKRILHARYSLDENTVFSEIKRLQPGQTLVFENGKLCQDMTIDALSLHAKQDNFKRDVSHQDLTDSFQDSMTVHLRADVDIGLFFSGGVDSSIILYWMSKLEKQKKHLFIAGFPESEEHDETAKALKIAENMGCIIHRIPFTEEDFWHYLPLVTREFDDPVIDPAALATYKLAETANKHVKVVLCGEGGDEFFSGYRRHQKAGLLGGVLQSKHSNKGLFRNKLNFIDDNDDWHAPINRKYQELNKLPYSKMQKMQLVDACFWLPNDLLTKLDRCSMAFGLEGRTPFVDQVMSPYMWSIKDGLKVNFKVAKLMIRKWLKDVFPESEPFAKKQGFKLPIYQWLSGRRQYLLEYLPKHPAFAEIAKAEDIQKLIEDMDKSEAHAVYALLYYAHWFEQYGNRSQRDSIASV
ncbi:MAG: asparagine synthase (glutamine-hydrolyzing) [Pseudomonadales bacterium]